MSVCLEVKVRGKSFNLEILFSWFFYPIQKQCGRFLEEIWSLVDKNHRFEKHGNFCKHTHKHKTLKFHAKTHKCTSCLLAEKERKNCEKLEREKTIYTCQLKKLGQGPKTLGKNARTLFLWARKLYSWALFLSLFPRDIEAENVWVC